MLGLALVVLGVGLGDPPLFDEDDSAEEALPRMLSAEEPTSYAARLSPAFRFPMGHAKVRENAVQGTKLDLGTDLGLRMAAGVNAQFEVETSGLEFLTEVEEIFGWGGASADHPFAWNGTVYTAPSQVRTHSSFLTVRSQVAFKMLSGEGGRSWLGPVVGIEWPYYTVSVGTNLQHGSLEDWVHYLPYPVLGAAGRVGLSDHVDLGARVTVGYLPNIPSPYIEGGRLYVAVRPSVWVEVPLAWRLSSSFELSCTLTYQYWVGTDHSNEDGNLLVLSSPGVMLGIAYRW